MSTLSLLFPLENSKVPISIYNSCGGSEGRGRGRGTHLPVCPPWAGTPQLGSVAGPSLFTHALFTIFSLYADTSKTASKVYFESKGGVAIS